MRPERFPSLSRGIVCGSDINYTVTAWTKASNALQRV